MSDTCFFNSPIGGLGITVENNAVTRIFRTDVISLESVSPLHRTCIEQLIEYFSGQRKIFTVPIELRGTVFQKKVWETLLDITYGKTASYADIARAVGSPRAARAVGNAVHLNPIPIIVPCHRVISSSGLLGGFAWGTDVKEYLLTIERGQS